MSFETALLEELADLAWADGPEARGFMSVLGAGQDVLAAELKDSIKMTDPLLAPSDALDPLSRDRLVIRAPVESGGTAQDNKFRMRLSTAPEDWYWAGTEAGYIRFVFGPYGLTAEGSPDVSTGTVKVLTNHEVSGQWDGGDWFSRVFFIVDARDLWSTDGLWPEDVGDAGGDVWSEDTETALWDSSLTVGLVRFFRAAIRRTKADDAYPVSIAVWVGGAGSLPDGYWDSPGEWAEDVGDAGGAVWDEGDSGAVGVYVTLGHVWGEESWTGDGPGTDFWTEDDEPMEALHETQRWIAFPGEE